MTMRIEKLPRPTHSWPQEWEVWAPDGKRFIGGAHSRVTTDKNEAQRWARDASDLEPCPNDCDCQG